MLDKYFSWIDGWDGTLYYVQVSEINYYTWMYSDVFIVILITALGVGVFVSIMLLDEDGPTGIGISCIATYFILPPVLSGIMYCWEISAIIVIAVIAYSLWNNEEKAKDPIREYKNKLSI